MKSHSKNKYAQRTGRSKRLKDFMHKVEVWLPTKTYNTLKQRALAQGQDMSIMAALGLYRAINSNSPMLDDFYIPFVVSNQGIQKRIVDTLSKYILATLKSGIKTQDLMMLGLDAGVSFDNVSFGLSYLINQSYIEQNDDGFIRYKYYGPIARERSLNTFKGKKVVTKEKKPKQKRESLVKKPRRTNESID